MNRLDDLLAGPRQRLLNVYFTAGYPQLDSTMEIIQALDAAGVDLVEIGLPYSDPLADGPIIQQSSEAALRQGMTIDHMFSQIGQARQLTDMPFIVMGYFNPVLQYGEEKFFAACWTHGVDALIIPDLPLHEYAETYAPLLEKYNLRLCFLITPQTPEERIRYIDTLTTGFIYVVSSSSITGVKDGLQEGQVDYFQRIRSMNLQHPQFIGFGISNRQTFDTACDYARGAIVGSAYIRHLGAHEGEGIASATTAFIQTIKPHI